MRKYIILAIGLSLSFLLQAGVRVAWDPNPENDIAGYRVYYWQIGSGLTNIITVGHTNAVPAIISPPLTNITAGVDFQAYVTAYNTAGLESDPSSNLVFRIPTPPASFQLHIQP